MGTGGGALDTASKPEGRDIGADLLRDVGAVSKAGTAQPSNRRAAGMLLTYYTTQQRICYQQVKMTL
jgi:hypothetical protein